MQQPLFLVSFGFLILLTRISCYNCSTKYEELKVPDGFIFGAATAAYQVEGAWNVSGRTECIWDVFATIPGNIKNNDNANEACKSYEFWNRDIEMLKYLNVTAYRFSISWPRLLPTGRSNFVNPTAVEYYNNLINGLTAAGIQPIVTIYHWDLPQNFQILGGWANPLVADWLEDFAQVLFDYFGDRVKTWITINEPYMFGYKAYGDSQMAPGINDHGFGEYITAKNMLMAHARVYHLYNNTYRHKQHGIIGIVNVVTTNLPNSDSDSDRQTAYVALLFDNALYMDPVFSEKGGFPDEVTERVAKKSAEQGYRTTRFPQLTQEEIDYMKGTSDFFGMNYYYATSGLTRNGYYPGKFVIPSMKDDVEAEGHLDFQVDGDEMPTGLREALIWVSERYNKPPIMITENGYLPGAKGLNDVNQLNFHRKYLYTIVNTSLHEDVNVVGYIAWSLMDAFEWNSGYTIGLGLFETDFTSEDRTRTLRLAGAWYRDVIASGKVGLNLEYVPKLPHVEF